MSLIVSIRVPDGVVIAGDSLATTHVAGPTATLNMRGECPKCHETIDVKDLRMPPMPMPVLSSSSAQKVMPFLGKYGVGIYGASIVRGATVYSRIRMIESEMSREEREGLVSAKQLAGLLGESIKGALSNELSESGQTIPDHVVVVGLQVVGFEDHGKSGGIGLPCTVEVGIGHEVKVDEHDGLGITWSGEGSVTNALMDLFRKTGLPPLPAFSLQDAVDFSEYLISTTSGFERFASKQPTVGGQIDIALVTVYSGFIWIKHKPLAVLLERRDSGGNGEESNVNQ